MAWPPYYVLDKNGVEVVATREEWEQFFGSDRRRIAETSVGELWVSTVFLGLDHRVPIGNGPPLLYETLVFGLPRGKEIMERHSTRSEAIVGHKRVVEQVREMVK
jgi:hypothetical protein